MSDHTYEIRVSGLVSTQDLLDQLGDAEIATHELRTVLAGRFTDQAALYGFLNRLRAYGLEVVEVRRVPSPEGAREAGTSVEAEEETSEETADDQA